MSKESINFKDEMAGVKANRNGVSIPVEEVDETMEALGYEAIMEEAEKSKPVFDVSDQVTDDLGSDNLSLNEEQFRSNEFERQADPIIEKRVNDAMKSQVSRLKREAVELLYEKDEQTTRAIRDARRADEKRRARRHTLNTIKSCMLAMILLGGIYFACTNSQVQPLLKTVFGSLVEFVTDIVQDEETSSNGLLESVGNALNDANTTVIYVEEGTVPATGESAE